MRYYADTESTLSNPTEIWLWGIKKENSKRFVGYDVESLLSKLEKISISEKSNKVNEVYFFNAKWDNSFILDYMLKNGFGNQFDDCGENGYFETYYNEMGTCFSVEIFFKKGRDLETNQKFFKSVKLIEAYNLLGGSIKKWGDKLNLPKGETPLYYKKPFIVSDEDIAYLDRDINILEKAYIYHISKGFIKKTKAANSLMMYKKSLNKNSKYDIFRDIFPILTDNFFPSYRGGWVFVNPLWKGREVKNFYWYDKKSMYPDKMKNFYLPWGYNKNYDGYKERNPVKLYIYNVDIKFKYKPFVIPFIRIKTEVKNKYPKEYDGEIQLTCVDLDLLKKHAYIDHIYFFNTYEFDKSKKNFYEFIVYWFNEKDEYEKKGDHLGVRLAKDVLVSLYGKLGSKINGYKMMVRLKDERLQWYKEKSEDREPYYIPVANFITSYSRLEMVEVCEKVGWKNVIYGDTDSIFTFVELVDNVGTKIGQWENKSPNMFGKKKVEKGTFFETKQYVLFCNNITDIKCSGLKKSSEYINLDDEIYKDLPVKPVIINKKTHYEQFINVIKNKTPIAVKKRKTVIGGSILYNTTFVAKFSEKTISIEEYLS